MIGRLAGHILTVPVIEEPVCIDWTYAAPLLELIFQPRMA